MNYVWLFLVAIAIITGAITGNIENVTTAAIEMAGTAVEISIGLVGIMTLWLGIMKIAEEAGMIRILARLLRPVSKWLFPQVPSDHPAIGAMTLNIAANWLGLGNAATPFGIKAMEHLSELNQDKETASNAMIMLLGLNTASITLIPMTIIGVRTSLGSAQPAAIIGTTIFASGTATLTAIITVKIFTAFSSGQIRRILEPILYFFIFIIAAIILLQTGVLGLIPADGLKNVIMFISKWAIPFILFIIPMFAVFRKIKVYEVFIEGAKEGFQVAIRIIPFLVAILAAVGMFRASGAMSFFINLLSPLTDLIGMPAEILPAALMRPLSGSGTLGIITELLESHGPDSFIGYLGSTIYGCTETTFYVIAVYFGAIGIKKTRFAIPVGLIADVAGVLAAVLICKIVF